MADVAARTELRLSGGPQEVLPGVWTSGAISDRPHLEGRSPGHLIKEGDGWRDDPYADDTALVVTTRGGLILICGCCHAGLLNTLAHVERTFEGQVTAIAGGMHLGGADPTHLEQVAAALRGHRELRWVYPGHCSGQSAYVALSMAMNPGKVRPCPSGTRLDLRELLTTAVQLR